MEYSITHYWQSVTKQLESMSQCNSVLIMICIMLQKHKLNILVVT